MSAATPFMTLRLGGNYHTLPAGSSLAALLLSLGHEPDAFTTAVNGEFVPRLAREACLLRSGDSVLLFQPIVGG